MALKDMAYDHPTYITRHAVPIELPATAASTSVAKFPAFNAMRIKSISAMVKTAGTSTAAGYGIFNGTASVGFISASTNAALAVLSPLVQNIVLASGGYLDIKTVAESATMAATACVEFEFVAGASVTA